MTAPGPLLTAASALAVVDAAFPCQAFTTLQPDADLLALYRRWTDAVLQSNDPGIDDAECVRWSGLADRIAEEALAILPETAAGWVAQTHVAFHMFAGGVWGDPLSINFPTGEEHPNIRFLRPLVDNAMRSLGEAGTNRAA